MDNEQVRQVAVGVLTTGHWPQHLGLDGDDRIDFLARQVEKLTDSVEVLDKENQRLSGEVEQLEDRLRDRNQLIEDLGECTDCQLCDGHRKDVTA